MKASASTVWFYGEVLPAPAFSLPMFVKLGRTRCNERRQAFRFRLKSPGVQVGGKLCG